MSHLALVTATAVAGVALLAPTALPPERQTITRAELTRHSSPSHGTGPVQEERLVGGTEEQFDQGRITLHLNREEEELYIDAAPNYTPSVMRRLLSRLHLIYGVEVLDEDEAPPEILDDGTVRLWLAEVA